jgi:hypothetical protein
MNKVSISTLDKITDVVLELAQERYPNRWGYQGLMQEIALNEFGIGLTKDRKSYWKNGIIKDEKKFMMFALKYGV